MDASWIDLRPFPNAAGGGGPGATTIRARLLRAAEGVHLRFRIEARDAGTFAKVHLAPKKAAPARRDELWKTTCFEAFLGAKNSPAYFELNLAPSGDWAWYSFADYRKEMRSPSLDAFAEPRELSRLQKENALEVNWLVPYGALAGNEIASASLTAVLDVAGEISYWAAHHAGKEADFHLRASFASIA